MIKFVKIMTVSKLVHLILCSHLLFNVAPIFATPHVEQPKIKPKKEHKVNPFIKPNFFINVSSTKFKDKITLKNNDLNLMTLGVEVPAYEEYLRYGFNYSILYGAFLGLNYGFAMRANVPFSLGSFGYIAPTGSIEFGLSTFFVSNFDWQYEIESSVHNKFTPSHRIGYFYAFSWGVEYYLNQWIGISLEQKFNFLRYFEGKIKKFKHIDPEFEENKKMNAKPFDINLDSTLSLGLKVTF